MRRTPAAGSASRLAACLLVWHFGVPTCIEMIWNEHRISTVRVVRHKGTPGYYLSRCHSNVLFCSGYFPAGSVHKPLQRSPGQKYLEWLSTGTRFFARYQLNLAARTGGAAHLVGDQRPREIGGTMGNPAGVQRFSTNCTSHW